MLRVLLLGSIVSPTVWAAVPVPAGSLLVRPAHFFDLGGKTVRFTPVASSYKVGTIPVQFRTERGEALGEADFVNPPLALGRREQPMVRSWSVKLPFEFSFAGSNWSEIFVNSTGSLSLGRPETELYNERNPWADGTMRAVAASMDVRAVAGAEQTIAPLWATYGSIPADNQIYTKAAPDELIVTWHVIRRKLPDVGYDPEGPNEFQAVLSKTGQIDFNYQRVSERDGIAGIFPGGSPSFSVVDRAGDPQGDADPSIDILGAEVAEGGTILRFSLLMAQPVQPTVSSGSISYTFLLRFGSHECSAALTVGLTASASSNCSGATPKSAAFQIQGRRVDVFLSKSALDTDHFSWSASVRRGAGGRMFAAERVENSNEPHDEVGGSPGRPLKLRLAALNGFDLSAAQAESAGNIFEVFYYPAVTRQMDRVMSHIYARHEAIDDMAAVLTDFRIDDLFDHGPSTSAINVPIQGIGRAGRPRPGSSFRSSRLQVVSSTIFPGPRFSEHVSDADRQYHGYAFAVGWIVHELTHRWSAFLLNQKTEDRYAMLNPNCQCHWSENLATPSLISVAKEYTGRPYPENSPMGGAYWMWEENADGTFSRKPLPFLVPMGMSALDLYAMGLMPAEEVPDTFLLTGVRQTGENRYEAKKTPIRIADIIAASGPRVPPASASQREFRLTVYMLHEDGRQPNPERLRQSNQIEAAVARQFSLSTGGRMTVKTGSSGAPK